MTNTQFAVFLNNIDNGIVAHHVKHDPNGMKVLSDIMFELTQSQNDVACEHLEKAGILQDLVEFNQSH